MRIDDFLVRVSEWAERQSDIVGVLLVGSYARGAPRPDSDLDLIILTADPQRYLDSVAFAGAFGFVSKREKEEWGRVTSVRVWYEDGLEVEYGFALPDWATLPLDPGTRQVVTDGMRIIFDRDGTLNLLSGMTPRSDADDRER